MRRLIAAAAAAAACSPGSPAPPPVAEEVTARRETEPHAPSSTACKALPYVDAIDVSEASGAVWFEDGGEARLLVVSDSGNDGEYAIVDAETGSLVEDGRLPLAQGASADLEGLAVRDGVFHAITSSGWIRSWRRGNRQFKLVDGPYPVADLDSALACGGNEVNCGKNYEGLCLAPGPARADECVGFAASKADGRLYCVVADGARLAATTDAIPISAPGTLSGCDVAPDGAVWAGTNLFGRSMVYRVTDWQRVSAARVEAIASLGAGFPEAIAVGPGGVVWRFSDMGGRPSLVTKFRCATPGR